jgi:hypothetical protein
MAVMTKSVLVLLVATAERLSVSASMFALIGRKMEQYKVIEHVPSSAPYFWQHKHSSLFHQTLGFANFSTYSHLVASYATPSARG